MNRLSKENSAYLKHSIDQKIDWYPWSEEAFNTARKEDKPVFLSSGAVWCHWCHVMAKECFYDDDTARLLNENFVSIKLDRDERPDVDRRYQIAVADMGSGGGWPLSVFLTHDKRPFFGGTYFPPEDRAGRPGFKKVLGAVIDLYRTKRDDIALYTDRLVNAMKAGPVTEEELSETALDDAVKDILPVFDALHGGFGSAPKFPMSGAVEFLINRYFLSRNGPAGYAARKTLESMATGGFCDQLGGGFHRYSTDEAWIVPHFEKMADDNAWLLRNYLSAYSVFGDEIFREAANGIIAFISNVLSDPEGGFYASQDADVTPDDEGGYFTWTEDDFRKALDEEECAILSMHLMHERGTMHHDRSKKVLFVAMSAEEIAAKTGKDAEEVLRIIKSGKAKLLRERNMRQPPFIDRTFYTSINGMLASAYLRAYRIFKDMSLKEFALRSLDRTMQTRFVDDRLFHADGVNALLDDYAYLVEALISAYEVTGEISCLERAERTMELCIEKLWDKDEGGFFDTDDPVLGIRIKGIEDIPHPSGNSICIMLLLKLHFITKNDKYFRHAEKALSAFSANAKNIGIHAGHYFCALDAYFNPLKLTVNALPSSSISGAVLSSSVPYVNLSYGEDMGRVTPCIRDACFGPVDSPEGLVKFIDEKYGQPDRVKSYESAIGLKEAEHGKLFDQGSN
ncbi:MAG: thioredoxin domain-containing protein [Nitrospiraceae bacterium]|nr:MAG: thioredoxin domain-containing protein [Nitrospiraceae bacterium]